MSTVILGGGIIGSSIAYYLSENQTAGEIHIIESSSQLFSGASGYAAGFLAKDWFASSLAPLGALSFDLHRSLAAEYGGEKKWGYMKGTALSLEHADARKKGGARGDDWLREGTSRAETASGAEEVNLAETPGWLTKQQGGVLEKISGDNTVAQVDPLRLSKFLVETSLSRGVKIHNPAKATSVVTDQASGTVIGVRVVDLTTRTESTIACTNLIICTGPWTPQVFHELFPSSQVSLPISPLAGYSLVVRSPRYTLEHERKLSNQSHALFTTHPPSNGFSPEIFSREGGEIYIAGLNSKQIPLPTQAEDSHKYMDPKEMARLRTAAIRLMGRLAEGSVESTDEVPNTDDLEILREGLCFRPVSGTGIPIVSRVDHVLLGGGLRTGSEDKARSGRGNGGVFVATGHGPWGISLSLGTGKVIAEMVKGFKPAVDVSGLAVQGKRIPS